MAKKTATRTRSRIHADRKVPHRPLAEAVAQPPKQDLSDAAQPTPGAPQEWQVISMPAPPGIYAGIDYDGNGIVFRRVDTFYALGRVVTHLETLAGERIPASSIAQFNGPLPEFGDNPEFGMFVKVAIPVSQKG